MFLKLKKLSPAHPILSLKLELIHRSFDSCGIPSIDQLHIAWDQTVAGVDVREYMDELGISDDDLSGLDYENSDDGSEDDEGEDDSDKDDDKDKDLRYMLAL